MDNGFKVDDINVRRAQNFFDKYDPELLLNLNLIKKTYLGSKKSRICRFCGKSKPEVNFKNDAHILPQFLNCRNILSYYECDRCNDLFSQYEDSFASFIGPFRTLARIKGKKSTKIPKHKDPDTGFEISADVDGVHIISHTPFDEYEVDEKEKTVLLKTRKQSYIPINVYKSLVKIALCLIGNGEISKYSKSLQFLLDINNCSQYEGFPLARMFYYFIPGPTTISKPLVLLFRRKVNIKNISFPERTLVLYIPNHIYQIFIPFSDADRSLYKYGNEINLPIYPLWVDHSWFKKYGDYQYRNIDLSSCTKLIKEDTQITMKYERAEKQKL